ncbi:Translocon-associated protein subunit gamma [Willisornis vidua]|uniref:Translocon-associated protein subunit gamma n=1 Tax=Willisornis vidua TaxID=1566151 RepID=A0ABQ9DFR7_9PASS|nr:Translocon-associated protein subunit gamma [Willisornis vidua]
MFFLERNDLKCHFFFFEGLYWRIWHMDLVQSAVLYSVMTLISTYLVAFAYKNVKFVLKHKILWKKNEVADYEATTFSIFYNNTLFLVLVIIASFFVLKNFNPTVYPLSAHWNPHSPTPVSCHYQLWLPCGL